MIDKFEGENRFLSNFWPADVKLDDIYYPTVEHAYQAAKTLDPIQRHNIWKAATPGEAKRLGKKVTLRKNWEKIKIAVMYDLLEQKFHPGNVALNYRLLETGDEILIEGNTWGDTFWGICDGKGANWLDRLLMLVRSNLNWSKND